MRDGLTGLYNHTSCLEIMDVQAKSCARYGTVVSFIIADIDDFKKVNDTLGHQEGDRVLAQLAAMLRQEARESDVCCRFGGEEFAVIMPQTGLPEARGIAERIRAGATIIRPGGRPLTISLGVAAYDGATTTASSIVGKADRALYLAKSRGKNRVEA
jgi:diguanylate cyclase (GGDEF)-like protein